MTYREFMNKLSDEEFAQAIIDDTLLHMSCKGSTTDGKFKCPYKIQDCLKCIVKLLQSKMEVKKD